MAARKAIRITPKGGGVSVKSKEGQRKKSGGKFKPGPVGGAKKNKTGGKFRKAGKAGKKSAGRKSGGK